MIIEGKTVANEIRKEVISGIKDLGFSPSLTVILVGDDPASQIYVNKKRQTCEEIGIRSEIKRFPNSASQREIESFIHAQKSTDGILVQLPLPPHLDKLGILNSIPPEKDVDCFNSVNIGRLAQGTALLKPCTPSGIIEMLKHYDIKTQGKHVTIINNSLVVGQPLSVMLSQDPFNATVTVCHEHTKNLFHHTYLSDIVITAVGKYPNFRLPPTAIKDGSVVIDVAVNRIGNRVFGDVTDYEFLETSCRTSHITKVPGGVGLTTVAMLMKNTLIAAKARKS